MVAGVGYLVDRLGRLTVVALSATERTGDVTAVLITLSDDELEMEIEALPDTPLGLHDDAELSLAGIQDKLLLVELPGGGWARPIGGRPSTHIVKLDNRTHRGIVRAEHEAMQLAKAVGLTTVTTEVRKVAGHDCLFVERFDRTRSESVRSRSPDAGWSHADLAWRTSTR